MAEPSTKKLECICGLQTQLFTLSLKNTLSDQNEDDKADIQSVEYEVCLDELPPIDLSCLESGDIHLLSGLDVLSIPVIWNGHYFLITQQMLLYHFGEDDPNLEIVVHTDITHGYEDRRRKNR